MTLRILWVLPLFLGCVEPSVVIDQSVPLILPPPPQNMQAPVKFVVLGDGRATVDGIGPSAYWPGILAEALAHKPAFILNTGDLVKRGRDPKEWRHYRASLPIDPPMIAVKGNHDRGPYYPEVGVPPFFRWRHGPVEVFGLDSEGSLTEFTALVAQLDDALSESTAPWPIVFMHRPVWSRGNHGNDSRGFNKILVPVLDRHRVPVMFSGHDHDYERFCPSRGLKADHCATGGTTYIVTGGAATITVPFPGIGKRTAKPSTSIVFSPSHHFISVVADTHTLTLTAHRTLTGNVFPPGIIDAVTLEIP